MTEHELNEKIRETQTTLYQLQREARELEHQQHLNKQRDLQSMVNKCFRRMINNGTFHYAVICGVPQEAHTRASVIFNEYQLPAIHFFFSPNRFIEFERTEGSRSEGAFWFDTIFTGELPEPYTRGAHNAMDRPPWEEVDPCILMDAMDKRYQEMKKKIFEPTTPPL